MDKFDLKNVYILSAGWGLIRGDFLTPSYDITFSAGAEPYARRLKTVKYADFQMHLAALNADELRQVVDAFVRATLLAVPEARKNSMNAHTLPAYVLGVVKAKGQPIQLANAFESPVRAKTDGLIKASIEALEKEYKTLKETWGIKPELESRIPEKPLEGLCTKLLKQL